MGTRRPAPVPTDLPYVVALFNRILEGPEDRNAIGFHLEVDVITVRHLHEDGGDVDRILGCPESGTPRLGRFHLVVVATSVARLRAHPTPWPAAAAVAVALQSPAAGQHGQLK